MKYVIVSESEGSDAIDFAVRCMRNATQIYVRAQVGGKWGSYPLSNLDLADQQELIRGWFFTGHDPILLRDE